MYKGREKLVGREEGKRLWRGRSLKGGEKVSEVGGKREGKEGR